MTNAELIAALRWCGGENNEWCVDETYKCPLWNEDRITDECKAELMRDAANVIETLANPQVKIVSVARQYDDSAIYVEAALFYSDGTVVTSKVEKVSTMPVQIPSGCDCGKNRNECMTGCYFYVEDHDMGARIDWCSKKHQVVGEMECNAECKFYISQMEVRKMVDDRLHRVD